MSDTGNIKPPRRMAKDLPLTRLLPNMLTLLSLCSGLTAIRFALHEKWEQALLAIVLAAIFDVLDGRVARLLNITSKFGAELDSLSDAISFGVAPGLVLYLWTLNDAGSVGWIAVLFYVVCTALRLARFNTMLEDESVPSWAKSYFTGVPAPGGAGLAILPFMLVMEFGPDVQLPPSLMALWLIIAGGLMVSRVPTFALKGWRVPRAWVVPILVGAVLLVAAVITNPWLTLSGIGTAYLFSMPCAYVVYRRRLKRDATLGIQNV
jgi:CDP-diacylglycerol--serine O-phosphatidyltransferase